MTIHTFIDLINVLWVASGGQAPINYSDLGYFVRMFSMSGSVTGPLIRIATDSLGRLHAAKITICSILGCGHLVTDTQQIAGFCMVCGTVCCHQCLRVCALTGITVCRKHFTVKNGVVISQPAQKGLFWRLKARRIAKKNMELLSDGK